MAKPRSPRRYQPQRTFEATRTLSALVSYHFGEMVIREVSPSGKIVLFDAKAAKPIIRELEGCGESETYRILARAFNSRRGRVMPRARAA